MHVHAFGSSWAHLQPWLRRARWALFVGACAVSCSSSPTAPQSEPLATGRWSGSTGACLSVAESSCNFVAGCGHGQFPRPIVSAEGTFEVDGTYRIEAGPISIEPAPPAHFSGSVDGSRLILTVKPTVTSQPAASYSMTLSGTGTCSVPCL